MCNNFIFQTGPTQWLRFQEPRAVVHASLPDEVAPALSEIETAVRRERLYAAGFLAYEAAPAFDPSFLAHAPSDVPLLWFGLYEAPLVTGAAPFHSLSGDYREDSADPFSVGPWTASVSPDLYEQAFDRIKYHIARGDTYQVNYTFRLRAPFHGSPEALFTHLARAQKDGHAAFINTGRHIVCSASPELFFQLDGDRLISRPMKGTRRRGDPRQDSRQAELLRASEKDRAENLMIVDMVRNDMGRIAEIGSVSVPSLFDIECYPTVYQMTSTVESRTQAGFPEIMGALFPCASITGAPKIRTMEIIRSCEPDPRGIYTGCIGYYGPNRQALFNVAIRTAVVKRAENCVEYGVGGGIVWDSDCALEYQECNDKARILPGFCV